MTSFLFDSEEFQRELKDNLHHAGEVEFLRSVLEPGMHVVEAGANRGVTAVAISREIGEQGRIYALEPVPEFCAELKENLRRNAVRNASVHQIALSDRRGRIRFYKHGGGSGIAPAEDAESIFVEATTISDFLGEQEEARIDFLNLDCEGSELLVFQGARGLLEDHGPQIFCEVHRDYLGTLDQSVSDVAEFLSELGYEVRPIQVENLNAESSIEKCSHLFARQ